MTHVLDPLIGELVILESGLRKAEESAVRHTTASHRQMLESTQAALRILRAEREGVRECAAPPGPGGERPDCDAYEASESGTPCPPGYCAVRREPTPDELRAEREGERADEARKKAILGEAIARELAIAVNMFSSAGSPYGQRAFQMIDRYRKAHANEEIDKASEALDEMRDELRAEGRREERERVVKAGRRFAAHTLKTFRGTPLQDASEFADEMVGEFVDAVGHGDHWRGGEG